ncbi:TMV resistance protein N-like [Neltuma alba]|uniref:TMV resistance protein N-like n=1 Tax=Neltuma alba TaxID=207710 RepID=UPI0010A2C9B3|nr:TMV resistance protein N-like [Prosopis alba]
MDATFALMLIEAVLILLAIAISKAVRLISPPHDSCKDVGDSIPMVSSPSCIIVSPPAIKYDVFLSFRGEETRHTFSSYLYEALRRVGVHTFMDHKLDKGDHISPILLKTIEESQISLIIFSEDYASSTWCMNELVHIMKCKDKYGRLVIPIFYNIDPSNIRKQNGRFGDGFAEIKQRFNHDQKGVPEPELVKKIVKDVLSKLNRKSSIHMEGLVGINHQIQKVEELLSEARIVGIWGMGGIGKTTLARAVFDRLELEFEALCFAKDVRQQLAERNGLDELQKKFLKDLLIDDDINAYDLRSASIRTRLQRKKILLVLDDVDNSITAEDLIKAVVGLGKEVELLSHQEICNLNAFKQNQPFENYLELSKWVVDHCEGNPLALKVLGRHLYSRGKEEWESALAKLNQTPHNDIFNVLKLSFDGLDDTQKDVFLDLAFLVSAVESISVDCARRLCGDVATIQISELGERSLISVDTYGEIQMHALLIYMGLEISKQQLKSNLDNPIRLWRHEDIYRYFSINGKSDWEKPSKLSICEGLDYLSKELRFLHWEGYPLPSVPLQFCAENLIELKLPDSNIQQLWDQQFPNLKEINLWDSKNIRALPDLSQAPKIKTLRLDGCVNLGQIHFSTVPEQNVDLCIEDSGPMQINVGGSMKGRNSSGLVIVHNYLDVPNLTFNKVTMKVLVRGDGEERGVEDDEKEDEDDREMISENEREMSSKSDQVVEMTLSLMQDEQEGADEHDSKRDHTLLTILLIPNSIPRCSEDDVILTQTDSPPATKYDVFLRFGGEDTRQNFAKERRETGRSAFQRR